MCFCRQSCGEKLRASFQRGSGLSSVCSESYVEEMVKKGPEGNLLWR